MADFEVAVKYVLLNESGEFIDRPEDHGGPTKWGITLSLLRNLRGAQLGPEDVATLTQDQASQIYCEAFWEPLRLQQVDAQGLATAILDGAANFGARRSVVFAQRSMGAPEDGIIGPDTLKNLNAEIPRLFLATLMAQWQEHYVTLCESDHSQILFLRGWLRRARKLIQLS